MSIRLRRNSLRKSTIGIDSIRKSITNLSEGLVSIGKQSGELLKETRKSNLLKSKLIRQDAEFFKRRRENVLRKQREDELEASTVTGATRRQGNILQKSTRGFLGRILDFVATLVIGWFLTNLPKIIGVFKALFGLIDRVVGVFTGFVNGMRFFFDGIGAGIDSFLTAFNRFNFLEDDKNIKETFKNTENSLVKLNEDFTESINSYITDPDLQSAEKVAKDLGIDDSSEIVDEDAFVVPVDLENNEDNVEGVPNNNTIELSDEQENNEIDTEEKTEIDTEGVEQIERRNLGGPVEAGQPVVVGDAAGIDSRSAELFVPDVDGRIVSNNELEDITTGDDGTNEIDDLLSGLESGGSKISATPSPSFSAGGTNLQKDDLSKIKGVQKSRSDIAIMPMSTRKEFNFKSPKKVKRVIMSSNQNNTNIMQPSISSGKTKIVRVKQTSQKTLLDFQSIILSSG